MKILTPIKAIRAKCLDCSAGSVQEVRLCPVEGCVLYPYRMGHRPKKICPAGQGDEKGEKSATFTQERIQGEGGGAR